jgi:signal transduction histidine kinase
LARVTKIVQDLKEFSHVDEAEWQEADINSGLESTLNVVSNELKYKADVVRQYGEIPAVRCIPAQINQVLVNLLVNAAQAIESHGTITVRSGVTRNEVWVEIEDTGKGMTPETQKRIFEPFFTTKPVGKGTGLGLSLSYDIVVKRHGGRFDVRSAPDQGSTIRLWLPVAGPAS